MSRVPVRPPGRHKGLAPALGLAVVVVALFASSLLAIVLSMQILLHLGMEIVVSVMGL